MASLIAQLVKNPPAIQETLVRVLGREDPGRTQRLPTPVLLGFPCDLAGKRIRPQCGRHGFNPWVGKIPWERERLPTPVFWPGEFHGLYSPWDCKESDTTEWLSLHGFVIILPKRERLLLLWLQLPPAVILEPKKRKSVPVFTFPLFAMKWWDQMPWYSFFECWVLTQLFHSPLSPSSRSSLAPFCFLSLEFYHVHIWGCWYFSQQSCFQLMIHPAWHLSWCTLHIRY